MDISSRELSHYNPEDTPVSSIRQDHESQNLLWTNDRHGPTAQQDESWADFSSTVSFDSLPGPLPRLGSDIKMIRRKPAPNVETRYIPGPAEPEHAPKHIQATKRYRPLRLSWTFEICAIILSLAALAAIIVILAFEDGRPLGDWNGMLSLNTVVSVLGVASRASLAFAVSSCIGQGKWNWFRKQTDRVLAFRTFDEASRGTWGGAQLIWKLHIRHIATLGAITTIVMLGFDPFLQAVIHYEGQLDDAISSGLFNPSISTSTRLDSGVYQPVFAGAGVTENPVYSPYNQVIPAIMFKSQPDLGMSAAVFNGFDSSSLSTKSDPSFSCSTGNCTWPLLTSLAVCSACNDITHLVVRNRTQGNPFEVQLSNVGMNVSFTQFILPGLTMSNLDGKIAQYVEYTGGSSATLTATASYMHNDTITFKDNITMISSVLVMRADDSYLDGTALWENTSATAKECMLFYCTNAYQSSVSQGQFSQEIVHSWSNRNLDSYLPQDTPLLGADTPSTNLSKAWQAQSDYDFVLANGDWNRTDLQLTIPTDEATKFSIPFNASLAFNVSQASIGSTVLWLQNTFFSNTKMVYGTNSILIGPAVTQSLGSSSNLTTTFSSAADSISSWIRNSANTTQTGTLQNWVLHVRVRWGFLAVPCLAIAAGCVFAAITIWQTRRSGVPAWKTDVLASMVYGFEDDLRGELARAERELGDMDLVADDVRIRLIEAENGRFLQAQA